ncbi:hypothetical protein ACFY2R_26175 [Micromonospora olivasterospora]|uniref:Peptidase M23-like protein n=1 Tax=Micromonospora olivasterospora TaxID=1880 RepID=A0A562IEX6_MICOL|nr:hypothetical protein [Micromonospora olivasterospora]TWH69571.1 hypothetical protein JD77_04581 [Micromonospora olivasterospora]
MRPDDSADQKQTGTTPGDRSTDATSAVRGTGRHRADPPRRSRALLASTPVRAALATGVCCCLGVAAFAGTRPADEPRQPMREALADRAAAAAEAEQRASRSLDRSPAAPVTVSPSPTATPSATAKPKPKPRPKPKPSRPKPVAGLNQLQMDNAKIIVDVGVGMKVPRRGLVVAIATAMQESTLLNYASGVLPESQGYPHQAVGWDHDSVGLFQQRPSSGWGTVRDLMRPTYAARVFYEALLEVPGWEDMSVTQAAQAVQISAFPDAYAQHEDRATTVVETLT